MPAKRYEIKRYANATVHKNSHIYFSKDKHYYSLPYHHIGKRIKVVYSDSTVEMFYQQELLTVHPRNKQKYGYSTINKGTHTFPLPLYQRVEQ